MSALEDAVAGALREVNDPCSMMAGAPISVVDMGLVVSVTTSADGDAEIVLRPTTPMCTLVGSIMAAVEEVAGSVPGVRSASARIEPRLGWTEDSMSERGRALLTARREQSRGEVPVQPQEWSTRRQRVSVGRDHAARPGR